MKINIECDCGSVKATVESKHHKGYRAACYCDDCQAYAHHLQRSDTLDASGGTDIIPVMPGHYIFTEGRENIKVLRLSDKGMFRWYAGCCKTPLGNSMTSPSMPYHGVPARIFQKKNSVEKIEEVFGPIREAMQAQYAAGSIPPRAQKTVSVSFMLRVLRFIAMAKLTRAGAPSPFFLPNGKPISDPYVLNFSEREALRPLCGVKKELN